VLKGNVHDFADILLVVEDHDELGPMHNGTLEAVAAGVEHIHDVVVVADDVVVVVDDTLESAVGVEESNSSTKPDHDVLAEVDNWMDTVTEKVLTLQSCTPTMPA
jgi:hypothetical protein